jgi:hypothetical protein
MSLLFLLILTILFKFTACAKTDILHTAKKGAVYRTQNEEVNVATDNKGYDLEKLEIIVTISNNLDSSITTVSMQGFCSILRLEQQEGTAWNDIRNCASKAPIRQVTLRSNSVTIVRLPISLPYHSISPGIYRVSLVFAIGNEYWGKEHLISCSNEFTIFMSKS